MHRDRRLEKQIRGSRCKQRLKFMLFTHGTLGSSQVRLVPCYSVVEQSASRAVRNLLVREGQQTQICMYDFRLQPQQSEDWLSLKNLPMHDCTPGTKIRGANALVRESECVLMFMTVLSAKDPPVSFVHSFQHNINNWYYISWTQLSFPSAALMPTQRVWIVHCALKPSGKPNALSVTIVSYAQQICASCVLDFLPAVGVDFAKLHCTLWNK